MRPCNLTNDPENNRTNLPLWPFKPYALFRSHSWISIAVRVWKRSIHVKMLDFMASVTLSFDGWPPKKNWNYSVEALVKIVNFSDRGTLKFDGWPWTRQILGIRSLRPAWVQIVDFAAHVTLKFNGRPLKIIGHLFYTTSSFMHHFKSISEFMLELHSGNAQFGQNWRFFVPCDLKILWMTLKKRNIFYATLSFVHHFKAIGEFILKLQSGNSQVEIRCCPELARCCTGCVIPYG